MRDTTFSLFLLLSLTACNTPEQRLQRLQRDFMRETPALEWLLVAEAGDTLRLPLPPTPEELARVQAFAEQAQPEAQAIDPEKISPEKRPLLERLRQTLDVLAHAPATRATDPSRYVPDEVLRHFTGDEGLRYPQLLITLLDTLPAYYATVHTRWTPPADAGQIAATEERVLATLETLVFIRQSTDSLPEGLRTRIKTALPKAEWALKDYVGLCRSGLLERAGAGPN